jgi:hypothetical protein
MMSLSLELAAHLFSFLGPEGVPALLALHDSSAPGLRFRPSMGDLLEVCRLACVDSACGIPDVLALFAHYRQYILIDYLLHCHQPPRGQPFSYTSKALAIAASRGDAYLLRTLLEDGRLRVRQRALRMALYDGHARCVKMLLRSGRLASVRATDLQLAWPHRKTRRVFLKHLIGVVDPNLIMRVFATCLASLSARGIVPLMAGMTRGARAIEALVRMCVEAHRVDIAVRLIDRAAEGFSQELLEFAAEEGALGVVKRLLERGLDPLHRNGAAMRAAIIGDSARVIRHLLRVNAFTDDSMDLVLMHACFTADRSLMRAALKRVDCHPHAEVFAYACRLGRLEIAGLLADDPRVNPRADDDAGLGAALRNADAPLVEFLMRHPRTTLAPGSAAFARARATADASGLRHIFETA